MRTYQIQNKQHLLEVSKIIFGTTYLGNLSDHTEGYQQMDRYYELGGRCIDTARVYSNLAPEDRCPSEHVIGNWLRTNGLRKELVLSTKGGHPPYGEMHVSRLDAKSIKQDLYQSLEALQTDYIDLYWLHRDDETIPVGEIMDCLQEFVSAGLIRCIGASNWSVQRIAQANAYATAKGTTPFSASQIQWSLAGCTPEDLGDDTLVCMNPSIYQSYLEQNIPVMAFNAQAKGLFSKLSSLSEEQLPEKIRSRFLNNRNRKENLEKAERVNQLCQQYGVAPSVIALAYLLCNSLSCGAIIGCSSIEQLEESMSAQDFILSQEDLIWLNQK